LLTSGTSWLRTIVRHQIFDFFFFVNRSETPLACLDVTYFTWCQMVMTGWMLGNAPIVLNLHLSATRLNRWSSWTTSHRSLWSLQHVYSIPKVLLTWWIHVTEQQGIDGLILSRSITTGYWACEDQYSD
jgi:hypothetical protein